MQETGNGEGKVEHADGGSASQSEGVFFVRSWSNSQIQVSLGTKEYGGENVKGCDGRPA